MNKRYYHEIIDSLTQPLKWQMQLTLSEEISVNIEPFE